MKRCTILTMLFLLVCHLANAQDENCNPYERKIQFEGKAPAPWGIDGSVRDWQTILGTNTGDPLWPYTPQKAGNNWSLDGYVENMANDLDSPAARDDLRFLAHTSDAYNVYFYARRQMNASGEHTVFYFIDIHTDGFMNSGEPVLIVRYTQKKVTQLTLGRYEVDPDTDYDPTAGNYMTTPAPSVDRGFADGYSLQGGVVELFNATKIPAKEKLLSGEVFAAAVTEDGYGLEISVPWRYLQNWSDNSTGLQPGDIFAYHIGFQNGGGPYTPKRVVDNAGGCCGGLGVAGNAEVTVGDLQVATLQPGTSYRFRFSFTNNTNLEELVGLDKIFMDNFKPVEGIEPDYTGFRITAYRDDDCNGEAEDAVKQASYEFYSELSSGTIIYSSLTSIARRLKPGEKVCFIVDLEIAPDQVEEFSVYFNPNVSIGISFAGCFFPSILEGGKPINPAAFSIRTGFLTTAHSKDLKTGEGIISMNKGGIHVFPNPSKGIINVWLPEGRSQNINLLDNTGRLVKQWRRVQPGLLSINHLAKGVYFLRLADDHSKQVIIKKFVVN